MEEYHPVSNAVTNFNFIGDGVKVRPRVNMDAWPTLSDVDPSLVDYAGSGNPSKIDVYIENPDPSMIKGVVCAPDVYIGAWVRMDNQSVAHNALANTYDTSNVIGVVESKGSPIRCDIRVSGRTNDIFAGLDTSLDYFLSGILAGTMTNIPPSTTGYIKLKLGQAFGSSSFLISKGERVVKA